MHLSDRADAFRNTRAIGALLVVVVAGLVAYFSEGEPRLDWKGFPEAGVVELREGGTLHLRWNDRVQQDDCGETTLRVATTEGRRLVTLASPLDGDARFAVDANTTVTVIRHGTRLLCPSADQAGLWVIPVNGTESLVGANGYDPFVGRHPFGALMWCVTSSQ